MAFGANFILANFNTGPPCSGWQGIAQAQRQSQWTARSVMDSGVQRQWTARGQLNGDGRCLGDTMTMDDKEGASATAMSTRPTTEATKANAASRH
jgi:hypothetical protein